MSFRGSQFSQRGQIMPMAIRILTVILCLSCSLPVLAQNKKGKGKPKPEPVIELDPWGKPQHKGGEALMIWQDEAGWHIRAYAGGRDAAKFSGVVRVIDGKVKK